MRWVLLSLVSALGAAVGIVALVTSALGATAPGGGVVVTWGEVAFVAAVGTGSFLLPWLAYAVNRVLVPRRLAAGRTRVGWVRTAVTALLVVLMVTVAVRVLPMAPRPRRWRSSRAGSWSWAASSSWPGRSRPCPGSGRSRGLRWPGEAEGLRGSDSATGSSAGPPDRGGSVRLPLAGG